MKFHKIFRNTYIILWAYWAPARALHFVALTLDWNPCRKSHHYGHGVMQRTPMYSLFWSSWRSFLRSRKVTHEHRSRAHLMVIWQWRGFLYGGGGNLTMCYGPIKRYPGNLRDVIKRRVSVAMVVVINTLVAQYPIKHVCEWVHLVGWKRIKRNGYCVSVLIKSNGAEW